MYFDDTFCIYDVFGGDDNDSFYIGQLYNDERMAASGVSTIDPIATTLTARGFLSDGCSHPVTIYSGKGNDTFDVHRNKCNIELDGEMGNDAFVVRSFIYVTAEGNSPQELQLGNATIRGGEGVDQFYVAGHDDPLQGMPSYISNHFVDVDGGSGPNNLTLYGTEQNDKYIVKDDMVSSGGLSVKYINIANLAVAGEAGDDEITVLSTNPNIVLSLYGGLGSDAFFITPHSVSPVQSKNPRGHHGIIEHTIMSTEDTDYDGLTVRGVEASVMDNDGDYGYLFVVDQGGPHLMTEDGVGAFSFHVYPTTVPEDDLYFNVVAPAERDADGNPYVHVNGLETLVLSWPAGEMNPKEVQVTYNTGALKLDLTELILSLELRVDLDIGRTKDHRFTDGGRTLDRRFYNTDQHMLPVDIVLLPSTNSIAGAKSLVIKER